MTARTGRSRRAKGAAAENEVRDMIRAHGWTRCHRNFDSGSAGGGDIARGPEGIHLEVKRHEKLSLPAWLRQAEQEAAEHDIPVVAFRQSRGQWYACLPLDELLPLLRMREMA